MPISVPASPERGGFSLVEVLLALILLGTLVTLVGTCLLGSLHNHAGYQAMEARRIVLGSLTARLYAGWQTELSPDEDGVWARVQEQDVQAFTPLRLPPQDFPSTPAF